MTLESLRRRRILQGAASLFLPLPFAQVWAESEGALKLVRLPKVALVIGNAAYRNVPTLKNPLNDARGIGEALEAAGFTVQLKVDANRADMLDAIQAYAKTLAAKRCVGLFYFAGHGLQLTWRNYMLPVDASVRRAEDIAGQGVDVGGLLDGINRAANPMNVIILDACRENPFAADLRLEQKGLSQMDAPSRTMLAYATSPGNVASDGEGANGLYTENLLREMKVREAKIEDVFKRVRLGVRRQSKGAQIPWESTSLEEDFYFLPPEEMKKRSQEEEESLFKEELALFERARSSKAAAALEDYLRRYPSGRFAELAQLQLDRALAAEGERRIEIVPSAGNPNTAGTARADTRFRIGDSYSYRVFDRLAGGAPREITTTITAITDTEVIFNDGRLIVDLLGNAIKIPDGRRFTPRQDQPLEYSVGKKWTTRFGVTRAGDDLGIAVIDFKVAARERITVPAGTFDCFRIEGAGVNFQPGRPNHDVYNTYWAAPDQVRRPIAGEELRRTVIRGHVTQTYSERRELVSFRQG